MCAHASRPASRKLTAIDSFRASARTATMTARAPSFMRARLANAIPRIGRNINLLWMGLGIAGQDSGKE